MSLRSGLLALLLAGSATLAPAEQKDDRPLALRLSHVPVAVGAWTNPLEGDPAAVRAGHKLFRRHCAECHGEDAGGRGKAPPLVSERIQGARPGDLFWFLTNGDLGAGMPSWSRLPDARRWQLVSFLKTLQPPSPPAR